MPAELNLANARLTITVVAGSEATEHGHAFEGYLVEVAEHDDAGDPTGTVCRFALQPSAAELLASSLRDHLETTTRTVDDDPALRDLMDGDAPDGTVRVVTPIGNRAQRRQAKRAQRRSPRGGAA